MLLLNNSLTWVSMHTSFDLIVKAKFHLFFCVFLCMQINQISIICNEFLNENNGLHHLKCDLVLKCLLMCF